MGNLSMKVHGRSFTLQNASEPTRENMLELGRDPSEARYYVKGRVSGNPLPVIFDARYVVPGPRPEDKPNYHRKKRWFTIAYVTREGQPHPAHRASNFTRVYRRLDDLLYDLEYAMKSELGHRGAYAAVVWPGQISEWEALHGSTRPLYHVYEGGHRERI
jgi:hypothetical protein